MDNMDNVQVDILEMLEQFVEARTNNALLAAVESSGDEYVAAIFKLLNKYGVSGTKIISLVEEFNTLNKMFGKNTNEGVGEN